MRLTKKQVKKIKEYFQKQKDVVLVYLYGSFTRGATHKRSDVDFGILFDPPINTYYRLGEIINDLSDLRLQAEPDVRNIELKNSPVFLRNVIGGELIYCIDNIKRIDFELNAIRKFRDNEPLRQLKYYYMGKRLQENAYGYK